jgi:hypothetical protein
MSEDLFNVVLGLVTSAVGALIGWVVRTYVWRRQLRRRQRFFGLPSGSECLLVVNQVPGTSSHTVARQDAFALLELSALIKDCGAQAEIQAHDVARQGFGIRTEFCVGGPVSNRRTEAHLRSMLPGVKIDLGEGKPRGDGTISVGGESYRLEKGEREYAVLARLTGPDGGRPVFIACGQRSVTNQAAVRYLARHHKRLTRQFGPDGTFCLVLRVVNSEAYGPDLTELVADVTRAATTAPAPTAPEPTAGG